MTAHGEHVLSTFSGHRLDLDACDAQSIQVEDVAAPLSKICRFGAQTRVFYSVAQHAALVHQILTVDLGRPDLAMYALHHDSHEAFAGDVPTPLKNKLNSEGGGVYDKLTSRLDLAIAQAFAFEIPPKDSADYTDFKRADRSALILEARALLHDAGAEVEAQQRRDGFALPQSVARREIGDVLSPADAEQQFLLIHQAASARGR